MPNHDEALKLIIRGHRGWDDFERRENERRLVTDYFESLTAEDVEDGIATFEHADEPEERWAAAQVLIAYFRWHWRNGSGFVGATDLDSLVLSFSRAALMRIAGAVLTSGNEDDGDFFPAWTHPDKAFGKKAPNHRPLEGAQDRDINIAMYVELLRRQGANDIKQSAGQRFGVSTSVVTKAITLGNSDTVAAVYGCKFSRFSDDDLRYAINDYLAAMMEKSTR